MRINGCKKKINEVAYELQWLRGKITGFEATLYN